MHFLINQLLSRTLDDINKEEWLLEFGNVFGNAEQVVAKYGNLPDEKVPSLHFLLCLHFNFLFFIKFHYHCQLPIKLNFCSHAFICFYILQGFLYKCMGVILRKATHKQFVQNHLDMMFATIKHTSQVERDVSSTLARLGMQGYGGPCS